MDEPVGERLTTVSGIHRGEQGLTRPQARYGRAVPLVVLLLVVAALFAPAVYLKGTEVGIGSDYSAHNLLTVQLRKTWCVPAPHFLFHVLAAATCAVLRCSVTTASILVAMGCYLWLAGLAFVYLRRQWDRPLRSGQEFVLAAVTVAFLLCAPIPALASADGHLYFGYVALAVYHTPTMALLKPLAVLHFFLTLRIFKDGAASIGAIALLAALTVLSALAKPNYVMTVLPAVVAYAVVSDALKKPVNRPLLYVGIAIPAVLVLVWQFLFAFSDANRGAEEVHVVVAPFRVYGQYSGMIAEKLVLSIAFPLCVTVCYFREAARDASVLFAWTLFICGASQTYLFAETGSRVDHGNFGWSGQIANLILFLVSLGFFVRRVEEQHAIEPSGPATLNPSMRFCACSLVFLFHVLAGIGWYAANCLGTRDLW